MDAYSSTVLIVWILISWSSTCRSDVNCVSGNVGMSTCCFRYSTTTAETFHIKCPNTTTLTEIIDVVHLYGASMCDNVNMTHNCNISNNNILWGSNSRQYLSEETCLNTSYECSVQIGQFQSNDGDLCNGAIANNNWSDAVILRFNCGSLVTAKDVVTTSQRNEPNLTTYIPHTSTSRYDAADVTVNGDDETSTSRDYAVFSTSEIPIDSRSSPHSSTSTTLESAGNMTKQPESTTQPSSAAGAIGGGIAAVVVAFVIVIIIIFLVRRRKLHEKKNNFDNEKSNSNEHTYTDVDFSKPNPHKSKYEEANATQEKDFPLKHCDSQETSHYCYVGRNECHGKGHTNDEEKPQYDNVENMTYDTPKTNRVDNQDQNHYDNNNEEVENKNNERIDLYAVPNKAKTGVSGDNNKMSLKRNMDGSEYSIYPTLPAKCFDTLAEDPDRPKYAEIDMEKTGISASLSKNVAAKPSEDLNYAQIQF